jgi:hypothetical protein
MTYLDPADEWLAYSAGLQIREIFLSGSATSKLSTYVNYAVGSESIHELYGHEAWRVEKLRAVKSVYDPYGTFNFYAPIV